MTLREDESCLRIYSPLSKKKGDLYKMFLDMEIKYRVEEDDGKEDARALSKRALAEKASTCQAKALFKKY